MAEDKTQQAQQAPATQAEIERLVVTQGDDAVLSDPNASPDALDALVAKAYAEQDQNQELGYEPQQADIPGYEQQTEAAPDDGQNEQQPAEAPTDFGTFATKYLDEIGTKGSLSEASVNEAAQQLGVAPAFVNEFARLKGIEAQFNALKQGSQQPAIAQPGSEQAATPAPAENQQQQTSQANPVLAAKAFEAIGGSQNWDAFSKWSATGLSAAEIAAYESASPEAQVELIGIYAPRFQASLKAPPAKDPAKDTPTPRTAVPNQQQQQPSGVSKVQPFASHAEAEAAYASEKYRTDPNYRAEVLAREAATNAARRR